MCDKSMVQKTVTMNEKPEKNDITLVPNVQKNLQSVKLRDDSSIQKMCDDSSIQKKNRSDHNQGDPGKSLYLNLY